jgi:L-2,4-diaminobutyric acid acetyltransferase
VFTKTEIATYQTPLMPKLESPRPDDAPRLWEIARDSGVLDVNTPYSYALWCRDFAQTSVVAREADGTAYGFVTGYIRPDDPHTLFVWQVAVDESRRGRGLAGRMLGHLGERLPDLGCDHLEATVTPDNTASSRLFESFARSYGARLTRRELFGSDAFPDEIDHEPEVLFRIGPLVAELVLAK